MTDRALLNTLYVTTPGAYVRLDNDNVCVEVEQQTRVKVPLHHLSGVVTFGEAMLSPPLLHRCAESGIGVTLLDRNGRFKARLEGAVSGNVLLRQAQYLLPEEKVVSLARSCIAGKVRNSRHVLLRTAREGAAGEDKERLLAASEQLARTLKSLPGVTNLDALRGKEGDAARVYFDCMDARLIASQRETFRMNGRNRRPPLDAMNALLSFLYTLVTHDCRSALEGAGLDPQFGYLHALRPGRPSLALDLVEEFRPILAERLILTLINRQQLKALDFTIRPGGAVQMSDDARRTVLVAYQERKKEEVIHPLLEQALPIGLLPFIQARLMARFIRGDMEGYVPYLAR